MGSHSDPTLFDTVQNINTVRTSFKVIHKRRMVANNRWILNVKISVVLVSKVQNSVRSVLKPLNWQHLSRNFVELSYIRLYRILSHCSKARTSVNNVKYFRSRCSKAHFHSVWLRQYQKEVVSFNTCTGYLKYFRLRLLVCHDTYQWLKKVLRSFSVNFRTYRWSVKS